MKLKSNKGKLGANEVKVKKLKIYKTNKDI